MDLTNENLDPTVSAAEPETNNADPGLLLPVVKKRNCGKTGPRTQEGKTRSAQNAIKHGSCALTLILADETEEGFHRLLARWVKRYLPIDADPDQLCPSADPETLDCVSSGAPICTCAFKDDVEYDFILKTAQAEWHRLRCQRNYDNFLRNCRGLSPFNWTPEETKQHDLHLRYKNDAERAFQRTFRLLEQIFKSPKPAAVAAALSVKAEAKLAAVIAPVEPEPDPTLRIFARDDSSPTGFVILKEFPPQEGVTYPCPCPPPPNPCPDRSQPLGRMGGDLVHRE